MEQSYTLLDQFNELGELYKNNSQVLKHINMYIAICENSIKNDTPISPWNIERFGKIIQAIKSIN